MKRPSKLTVGPFEFQLIFSSEETKANSPDSSEHTSAFGVTRLDKLTVYIDPSAPMQIQRETLLHEILHCCWFTIGIENDYIEEMIVAALSPLLLDTLLRNKMVYKFIFGEDK